MTYIDLDKAIEKIYVAIPDNRAIGIVNILRKCKADDVAQVVHAHWIAGTYEDNGLKRAYYTCSHCQCIEDFESTYCPYCGARMDEDA